MILHDIREEEIFRCSLVTVITIFVYFVERLERQYMLYAGSYVLS